MQTLSLISTMIEYNVKSFIFSSSATVYGKPKLCPINETHPIGKTTNPYGTSKLMMELMLSDLCNAYDDFNVTILRYFNQLVLMNQVILVNIQTVYQITYFLILQKLLLESILI